MKFFGILMPGEWRVFSTADGIEEIKITRASPLVGRCLADTALGLTNEALVLAIRTASGQFVANPAPDMRVQRGV